MDNAPPARKTRRASGPVWCEHKGRSAVVTLVTPVSEAGASYVQWCSLVGTSIACDEDCVHRAAKWVGADFTAGEALGRRDYDPVREVVIQVRVAAEPILVELGSWSDWASSFVAGIASGPRAWRAAEEALCAAGKAGRETIERLTALAAADAAWAAVHAAAGNVSLAMESTARAHQLLRTAAAASSRQA